MYFSPKAGTLSKEKQVPGSAQAPPGMRTSWDEDPLGFTRQHLCFQHIQTLPSSLYQTKVDLSTCTIS